MSIASIHARAGFPNWAAYETSKAGHPRADPQPRGRVRAGRHPGQRRRPGAPSGPNGTRRRSRARADPDEAFRTLSALATLGRVGRPGGDRRRVVAFLLSDEASFVTGANVPVDGGAAARAYPTPTDPRILAGRRRTPPDLPGDAAATPGASRAIPPCTRAPASGPTAQEPGVNAPTDRTFRDAPADHAPGSASACRRPRCRGATHGWDKEGAPTRARTPARTGSPELQDRFWADATRWRSSSSSRASTRPARTARSRRS